MSLWFSMLWIGVRDKQQCSSARRLTLHCSCRLPGAAILAAFPPSGHTQPWNCQETSLLSQAICLWQCSFLLWAVPVLTAHSPYKRLDEELFIILNALIKSFLSTLLLCSEFWLFLRADLQFTPVVWRGVGMVKALHSWPLQNFKTLICWDGFGNNGVSVGKSRKGRLLLEVWSNERGIFWESQKKIVIKKDTFFWIFWDFVFWKAACWLHEKMQEEKEVLTNPSVECGYIGHL